MAQRDGGSSSANSSDSLVSFATEHIGILLPFIGALIFYIRCIAVTRGNAYQGYMLLSQTSIGDAVRALTFTAIPLVLLLGSFVAIFAVWIRASRGELRKPATPLLMLVSAVSFVGANFFAGLGLVAPAVFILVLMVLVGIPSLLIDSWARTDRARNTYPELWTIDVRTMFRWFRLILIAAIGIVLVWGMASIDAFWLPRERLVFRGQAPFTGYLLKASEEHFVILDDNARIVFEKPKADLLDRTFCLPFEISDDRLGRNLTECP
jgi:hypothetical protein